MRPPSASDGRRSSGPASLCRLSKPKCHGLVLQRLPNLDWRRAEERNMPRRLRHFFKRRSEPRQPPDPADTSQQDSTEDLSELAQGSASTPTTFEFEAIGKHELRLLTIAPATDGTHPVECLLATYDRDEHPGYAAISYTWGDTTLRASISCNGIPLEVGENCERALRALRSTSEPQTVWIDAVCIDQTNLEERQAQVANIGQVFRLAVRTFVYLGESEQEWDVFDGTSNMRWQALLDRSWFRRTWVVQELLLSRTVTIVVGNHRIPWSDLVALCEMRKQKLRLPKLISLRTEFAHDYARRPPKSWVYANDGASAGDDDELDDGDDVMAALYRPSSGGRNGRVLGQQSSRCSAEGMEHDLGRLRLDEEAAIPSTATHKHPRTAVDTTKESGFVNLHYWRLQEILEKTRQFDCQDPRDKLFAILPLFCHPIPDLLYPDYRKTPSQVYSDLAWYLIEQGDLAALKHLSVSSSFSTPCNPTPSWATYWPDVVTQHRERLHHPHPRGKAGFGTASREVRATRMGDRGQLIKLRGAVVGLVTCLYQLQDFMFKFPLEDRYVNLLMIASQSEPDTKDGRLIMKWTWTNLTLPGDEAMEQMMSMISLQLEDGLRNMFPEHSHNISCSMQVSVKQVHDLTIFQMKIWCPIIEVGIEVARSLVRLRWDERWTEAQQDFAHLPEIIKENDPFHSFSLDGLERYLTDQEKFQAVSPGALQHGDAICVLLGFELPVALRAVGPQWQILGECRVAETDVEDGRLVDSLAASSWWSEPCPTPLRDFVIC